MIQRVKTMPSEIPSLKGSHFKDFNSTDRKFYSRYAKAGIPTSFFGSKFSDYVLSPELLKVAKNYVRNFPAMFDQNIGFTISGAAGTGKTMLASIVAKYVSALYVKNVRLIQLDDFILLQNKSWMEEDAKLLYDAILSNTALLIVDDIPKTTNKSKDVAGFIHQIAKTRSRIGKPVIYTTSYTPDNLANLIGRDVVKELLENSPLIEIKSKDNYRDVISTNKLSILADSNKDKD